MERVSFPQWTLQELEQSFSLERCDEMPALTTWLQVEGEFTPHEVTELDELRRDVLRHSAYWSEEELKFFLIFPLIHMAHYREPLRFFAGRTLHAIVGQYELTGIVDGMVASGHYRPQSPYFCLHEYKPEEAGRPDDPAAQALSAMLAARQVNQNNEPVYGAYVLRRFWFFMALDGDQYGISPDYSTSKDEDIRNVVLILRKLNTLVVNRNTAVLPAA